MTWNILTFGGVYRQRGVWVVWGYVFFYCGVFFLILDSRTCSGAVVLNLFCLDCPSSRVRLPSFWMWFFGVVCSCQNLFRGQFKSTQYCLYKVGVCLLRNASLCSYTLTEICRDCFAEVHFIAVATCLVVNALIFYIFFVGCVVKDVLCGFRCVLILSRLKFFSILSVTSLT